MAFDVDRVRDGLPALRDRLDARAAGVWQVEGDRLALVAFDGADDLAPGAGDGFARAAASVPLDRPDFSIVAAVRTGRINDWHAADLPADAGSGYWLRAFPAARSVAVPIFGPGGVAVGVVSVATRGPEPPAAEVERAVTAEAEGWLAIG